MKNLCIAIAIFVWLPVVSQNSCSQFYPTEEGKTLIIHQLNKRERLSSITEFTVLEATTEGLKIGMILKDKRNEPITEATFRATCSNGTTLLEPESIMSGLMRQYEAMEYRITGDAISIPNDLNVGQSLPDAEVTMVINSGIMNITSTVKMTDRKVVDEEAISTPAGTFDCFVITYTNTLQMGLSRTMKSTQWIATGLGMIQEETRKENGNLITKSVLYAIN
ncbi:hypothetical protein [Dokdonia sp. Hel_I_53]|uniref:TapB family protein n=1 Tax=Dokdonia sp. Hel_I_53 TaxID=1566287 RepID=UPI00119B0DFD|nr:hypothetical protein [Dokdonia sp. Hel_I_53]TVZ52184.1 hypothetical protein OD90_1354 [Dokdonia sp. Hel_I_53]